MGAGRIPAIIIAERISAAVFLKYLFKVITPLSVLVAHLLL